MPHPSIGSFSPRCRAACAAGVTAAQDAKFPSRAVTFVVPFPPGGTADVAAADRRREAARALGPAGHHREPARRGAATSAAAACRPRAAGRLHLLLARPPARWPSTTTCQKKLPLRALAKFVPIIAAGAGRPPCCRAADISGEHAAGIDRAMPRPIRAS